MRTSTCAPLRQPYTSYEEFIWLGETRLSQNSFNYIELA